MTEDPPRLDRPAEPKGPHAAREGAGARGAEAAGYAARLVAGVPGPVPAVLLYPGPRDFSGFEAPAREPAGDPAGRHWDPPGLDRATIDWAPRPEPPGAGFEGNRAGAAGPRCGRPNVPGYEILEELGRGGMGVVYKARQLRLDRMVALKMILAGDFAGADAVERFLAEAQIVARLRHPNVVQIHAIGDIDGRPFVELEYIEGGSLAAHLDGTPWPPRSAARLVERLALALEEAHRLGIVHRDLKPANVLIGDDGSPKITDFGLAKAGDRELNLTRTDSILGSPSYMAPEQAEGRAREVGPAADIYAIGANLYELLTGRPPFVGPTILATLELVKDAEPVPPRQLQPGVSPDLETICLKCLRKEPGRRYESAGALAADLRRYLDGEPILARPTPRWERAWKWIRRRPATAALAAVSAASIVAVVAGGAWYRAERDRRDGDVRRRVESVRARAGRFLLLGEEAFRRRDWDGAKAQMSGAMALVAHEPELSEMAGEAARALELAERRIAERNGRAAERDRLSAFARLGDEAVFHQSRYAGLDPEADLRAARAAARQALDQFRPVDPPGRGLAIAPGTLDPQEARAIEDRYYELALIHAEAVAQPVAGEDPAEQARRAVAVLDRAGRVRPPSRIYFLRRAAYREAAGDPRGAADDRRRAEEGSATAPGSAVDDFLEGEAAYRRHDYPAAVQALRRLLMARPGHFWGHYLLALCHLKAHRPAEAQAELAVCQAARPGFVWPYLLKGFAEGELGEFDLAEAEFRRAAELGLDDDARYAMLVNRGVLRVRRDRPGEAVDDFRAAIAMQPDRFQAHVNLAQAYQAMGRPDKAVEALDRAIGRFPRQAVLYRARARAHRLGSRPDLAIADLGRAIAEARGDDPARGVDLLERAELLQRSGRHAEAMADCDRAAAIRPDDPDVHRLRGALLARAGRFEEAIRSFDVAIERGGPSAALHEARGLALARCGAYERAIADYTLAIGAGRPAAALRAHRGWAYLFSGAPAPALRDFDEALRLDPADARALGGRAMALVQQREARRAVEDARASIRAGGDAEGDDPRLAYNAARVLSQAAVALESEPSRSTADWATAGRLRTEALDLLARALRATPADERPSFWAQVVAVDAALEPIRRSRGYSRLEARFGRLSVARPVPNEGPPP